MTCPACGGRMRALPSIDMAECRKCRRRQTGVERATKTPKWPTMKVAAEDYSAWFSKIEAMYCAGPHGVPPAFYGISPPIGPAPRADGMDPAYAYVRCPACNERWDFPDMELGDYELLPCQHAFLRREPARAGEAAFYGPGADYVLTTEPPE